MRYLLLASLLALPLAAQDTPQAFTGGTIIPISGPPIMNGVLVVHQGRITAVGAVGQVPIPAGAQVHDVTGKFLMPGLVERTPTSAVVTAATSPAPFTPPSAFSTPLTRDTTASARRGPAALRPPTSCPARASS